MGKRKSKWHECNVLHRSEGQTDLWNFNASDRSFALKAEHTETEGNPLPVKLVGKTWRNLIQAKLNLGWVAQEHVFLRTIQMPECDPEELLQMLEFQLEKLSPAPVSQIVWSYEQIPSSEPDQITVLLIIVEAEVVEQQLTGFEEQGYHTDRLEMPWSHELVTLDRTKDRIWIRLGEVNDQIVALVAWVLNQTVQHVMVLRLPNSDEGTLNLTAQLDRTAWTGELESWLTEIPPVTVCGQSTLIQPWIEALSNWSSHPVATEESPSLSELAILSARRATRGDSAADLLPKDRRLRYRQQYIDGMWMKGLGAMILVYIFGILIYFVALEWKRNESLNLITQVRSTANQYTNVLEMEARLAILQEQEDLRFSALDCLRVIAEELPTELTLNSFRFYQGETLTLNGSVPSADSQKVSEYHLALINTKIGDEKLFKSVDSPNISPVRARGNRTSTESTWNFKCTLARTGFQ